MLPRDQSAMRVAYYTAVRDKLKVEVELRAVKAELDRVRTRFGVFLTGDDMNIGRNVAALIERALEAEGGTFARAARRLGVNVSTLWRWRHGGKATVGDALSHYGRGRAKRDIAWKAVTMAKRVEKLKLVQGG